MLETDYLDRDYTQETQEYSAFYSKQFRRYRRHAKRIHFFAIEPSDFSDEMPSADLRKLLEAASTAGAYIGFLVLRPVEEGPICRAVLSVTRTSEELAENTQTAAKFEAHVCGATLSVSAMPFMQQDARLSACAQACIWMCGRQFEAGHSGPWVSTVAITEAASKPTDSILASSLPAGAGGLSLDNTLRALRFMERQPLPYKASTPRP